MSTKEKVAMNTGYENYKPFPEAIRTFIKDTPWVFAKTYAKTWPHEYIVRKRVDECLFVEIVKHIRAHGYAGKFYKMDITYFDDQGITYWTMGSPVETTTIINRCPKENTYEERLKRNDLPDS